MCAGFFFALLNRSQVSNRRRRTSRDSDGDREDVECKEY